MLHMKSPPPGAIEVKGDTEDDATDIVIKSLEDLKSAMDARLADIEAKAATATKATERLDAIEVKLNRFHIGGRTQAEPDGATEQKAFASYIRGGVERMGADEQKALTVSTETTGGYLAPQQFLAELDRNLVLTTPIRQYARVSATNANSVRLPKRTSAMTAVWVGENETRTATQPVYGATDLQVFETSCYVDISNQLLEDAGINIASELAHDFAEEFGRIEGAACVNGDGIKKPLGLLNTSGISFVKTGTNGGFTPVSTGPVVQGADAIFDLYYALPTAYAANAVFGMNRTTMGAVRKLKTLQGGYLWADPIAADQPPTLLGRPVVEMPDMPDPATNSLSIVFGDFSNFRMFDRVALSVLRDPYSQATAGNTRFIGRRRIAAGVTKAEAFKFLKFSP